mmetsp:Transcript_115409/g.331228  ORF Transcript_115409/g.331228 Transcript_115409/m.331228 type:complete len:354 (-) Transcript_115409:12-1073(-)
MHKLHSSLLHSTQPPPHRRRQRLTSCVLSAPWRDFRRRRPSPEWRRHMHRERDGASSPRGQAPTGGDDNGAPLLQPPDAGVAEGSSGEADDEGDPGEVVNVPVRRSSSRQQQQQQQQQQRSADWLFLVLPALAILGAAAFAISLLITVSSRRAAPWRGGNVGSAAALASPGAAPLSSGSAEVPLLEPRAPQPTTLHAAASAAGAPLPRPTALIRSESRRHHRRRGPFSANAIVDRRPIDELSDAPASGTDSTMARAAALPAAAATPEFRQSGSGEGGRAVLPDGPREGLDLHAAPRTATEAVTAGATAPSSLIGRVRPVDGGQVTSFDRDGVRGGEVGAVEAHIAEGQEREGS